MRQQKKSKDTSGREKIEFHYGSILELFPEEAEMLMKEMGI